MQFYHYGSVSQTFWPRTPVFNLQQCRVSPLIWASLEIFYTVRQPYKYAIFGKCLCKEIRHSDVYFQFFLSYLLSVTHTQNIASEFSDLMGRMG